MTTLTTLTGLKSQLRRFSAPLALAVAATGLMACDDPEGAESVIEVRDGPGSGGPWNNTNVIYTSAVDAVDTRGLLLDGVRLAGVEVVLGGTLIPVDVNSLAVTDGTVEATVDGAAIDAAGFVGSEWTFEVGDAVVTATLATVETSDEAGLYDPLSPDKLVQLDPKRLVYTFTYGSATLPIETCKEDSDAGARAVLYGDLVVDNATGDISQRQNTIYFGCISGAVGKAAVHGYAPDNPSLPNSLSLPEFETAVRALRADYCGDGTANTNTGNLLTYTDRYAINSHSEAGYKTEAVWEVGGGARCVNWIRKDGSEVVEELLCPDGHSVPRCGTEAQTNALWATATGDVWTKIP